MVATTAPIAASVAPVVTGPQFTPTGFTRAQASSAAVALPFAPDGQGVGKNRAMMGVGLASIVVGIIAGGDIGTLFIVGGGVIGLVGLYHYMQ